MATTFNNWESLASIRAKLNANAGEINWKANLSGATFTGDISVPDEAYGVGWNGSLEVPTKNAIYDKIETIGGWAPKEMRITIPWEQIADINAYQGMYFKNTSGASWTITNVAVSVAKAAVWAGAACSVNVYKSSGTASDWINTSAVNLFTSAIALGTGNDSLTNVPNTTTVENGRWLSLRVTSSAGATNKASDLQVAITLA